MLSSLFLCAAIAYMEDKATTGNIEYIAPIVRGAININIYVNS